MGNGSPHESCLVHTKVQADIDKLYKETTKCSGDRKEIWGEMGKKSNTKFICWVIGIIVSIFMAFMTTGFYVLSAQISTHTSALKETTSQMSDQLLTVKTDTEVIKTQIGNLDSQIEKLDKRVERIEHNNKKK